jgi:cytochrome b6-f complex iron-sulfur subunit
MSNAAILAIVVAVVVLLAAVVVVTSARRGDARRGAGALSRETRQRDAGAVELGDEVQPLTGREVERAAAEARSGSELVAVVTAPPAVYVPPDPETVAFTRRQFFNRSSIVLMIMAISGFGAACIAFLWPKLSGGFGSKITVGTVDDVIGNIRGNKNFFYLPEGRAWLTEYPKDALPKAKKVYAPPVYAGMEAGVNALYQKCPHLGCRVPECLSSQWFECPCHGSQYNRVGEKKGGPAPRGMDRFGVQIISGNVVVNTGQVFPGPPIGTNTTGQEAEGPHCIGTAGAH